MKAVNTNTTKQVSNYKANVIEANKALNVEKNSLGAYIDLLIKYDKLLCIEFKTFLDTIKDGNKENYELLKNVVKTTKNGKFNQFYTLQGLQKVCFPKK
jgi:plasmid replication initiation protein